MVCLRRGSLKPSWDLRGKTVDDYKNGHCVTRGGYDLP